MRASLALALEFALALAGCTNAASAPVHNEGACWPCSVACRALAAADNPTSLLADDARLYFLAVYASSNTLPFSMPKSGGPLTPLFTSQSSDLFLYQSSDALIVVGGDGLSRIDKATGALSPLALDSPVFAPALGIDDSGVYFASEVAITNQETVDHVAYDGSPPAVLADTNETCRVVALDADWVYCSTEHELLAIQRATGTAIPLSAPLSPPVVADDQFLYAVDVVRAALVRLPKTGGTAATLATTASIPSMPSLAADSRWFYWSGEVYSEQVYATSRDGASTNVLCSGLDVVNALAADGRSLYVATAGAILALTPP